MGHWVRRVAWVYGAKWWMPFIVALVINALVMALSELPWVSLAALVLYVLSLAAMLVLALLHLFKKRWGPAAANVCLFPFALAIFVASIFVENPFGRWQTVGSLPEMHKVDALWFDGDVGLVLGHFSSLDDILNLPINKSRAQTESVVLRSEDRGQTWQKTFSGSGWFRAVSQHPNGVLFASGMKHFEDGRSDGYLLSSDDGGKNWSELPRPPEVFVGIDFSSPKVSYAWTHKVLYRSLDQGRHWILPGPPVQLNPIGTEPVVDKAGTAWADCGGSIVGLAADGSQRSLDVPHELVLEEFAVGPTGELWAIGRKDETLQAWRYSGESFVFVSDMPWFLPAALHVGNTRILIPGSDMTRLPPTKIVMHSDDLGRTWRREQPSILYVLGASFMKPLFFEGEDTIWAYTPGDRIMRGRF